MNSSQNCEKIKLGLAVFAAVFGHDFRRLKYFTGKIEAVWIISFKIKAKIEVREHLYCVSHCVSHHIASLFLSDVSATCSSNAMRLSSAFCR